MVAIIIKEKPNFVKKKKGAVYGGILSVRNGPLARIKTEWNSIADMKVGNKIQVIAASGGGNEKQCRFMVTSGTFGLLGHSAAKKQKARKCRASVHYEFRSIS